MLEHRFGTVFEEPTIVEDETRKHEHDIYLAQYPAPEKAPPAITIYRMGDRALKMTDSSYSSNPNVVLGSE